LPDSPIEPIWFKAKQIESLNRIVVQKNGEPHCVMNSDMLASAAGRPCTYLAYNPEAQIIELGVVLIDAIGKNHCFLQGNKRTAFHAGISFMRANKISISVPDTEENAKLFQGLIEGTLPLEEAIRLCEASVVVPV
jgi:death-on-curing protein